MLHTAETEIQQVDGSESMNITLAQLAELVGNAPTVEAFGELDENDCLVADVIVVES